MRKNGTDERFPLSASKFESNVSPFAPFQKRGDGAAEIAGQVDAIAGVQLGVARNDGAIDLGPRTMGTASREPFVFSISGRSLISDLQPKGTERSVPSRKIATAADLNSTLYLRHGGCTPHRFVSRAKTRRSTCSGILNTR